MFNKKIITITVSAVLILALAGVGIYGAVTSGDKTDGGTTVTQAEATTNVNSSGESTEAETTTPVEPLSKLILGKWTDSADMSGYAFYEDGTVEMTYVNLTVPIINMPINGTAKGVYTLDGDRLTTKFSIYSATIENSYTVKVEKNILSMYNLEDRETATYSRASAETTESTSSATTKPADTSSEVTDDSTDLIGSWINSDGTLKYKFNSDGTAKVSFKNAEAPDISESPVTGSYSGVYMIIDDEITIQYTAESKKITERYTFSAARNSLSLKKGKDTTLFVREGTTFTPSTESDLLGKWMDGANMSGYEFLEGGIVKVTYVNFTVPVINMPINGTYTGSYTISDNSITLNYSIYGKSITDSFAFSIDNNVLSFVDEEGKTSTYIKQ